MKKHTPIISTDNGSILLVSLVILVALSIIGGIALKITDKELKLAGNDKTIQRLVSRTESASVTAIENLETTGASEVSRNFSLDSQNHPWMTKISAPLDEEDNPIYSFKTMFDTASDIDTWTNENDVCINCEELSATGGGNSTLFNEEFSDCKYRIFDIERTGSLQEGNSYSKTGYMDQHLHNFASVGYCTERSAKRMIIVGYRFEY